MKALTIAFVVTMMAGYTLEASPVAYQKIKVGRTWAHVVTVNMNDNNVKIAAAISQKGRGSSESFSSMMKRTRPKAAITGTFFDTRSLLPIGDIGVDGQIIHTGCYRAALCVSPDNKARIAYRRRGAGTKWDNFETVVSGGITLVHGGKIVLAPKAEGFRDRALFSPNRRTAVGVTRHGKLLLVAVNHRIYLRDLAHVMIKLGAVEAIALDGGSSSAMYYSGRSVTRPARKLTNVLLVYDNPSIYKQARKQFAPTILMASADNIETRASNSNSWTGRFNTANGYRDNQYAVDVIYTAGLTSSAPVAREPLSGHIHLATPGVSILSAK